MGGSSGRGQTKARGRGGRGAPCRPPGAGPAPGPPPRAAAGPSRANAAGGGAALPGAANGGRGQEGCRWGPGAGGGGPANRGGPAAGKYYYANGCFARPRGERGLKAGSRGKGLRGGGRAGARLAQDWTRRDGRRGERRGRAATHPPTPRRCPTCTFRVRRRLRSAWRPCERCPCPAAARSAGAYSGRWTTRSWAGSCGAACGRWARTTSAAGTTTSTPTRRCPGPAACAGRRWRAAPCPHSTGRRCRWAGTAFPYAVHPRPRRPSPISLPPKLRGGRGRA